MSLTDYYKILQVPISATNAEIKAAFRRLAKMYHPDKNPGQADEEKFKLVKEAYDNLINPQKRARYDSRRGRATTFSKPATQQKQKKDYGFSEEEAKRRQYYQQHYKKAQSTAKAQPSQPPRQQSELKYILISVPVAVALLLLIIRIYEKPLANDAGLRTEDTTLFKNSEISTPEVPYKGLFMNVATDTNSRSVLKLVNRSGYDAVVFLRDDSLKTVRHHFIGNNYQLLAEQLAPASYHLYFWLGKHFSYKHFLFDTIMGNFAETVTVDTTQRLRVSGKENDTISIELQNTNRKDNMLLKKIFAPIK